MMDRFDDLCDSQGDDWEHFIEGVISQYINFHKGENHESF